MTASLTVDVRDVSRTYRAGAVSVDALHGISFGIEPGTVVVLIGPSGSGKTTLLNIVAGLDRPTSGEVYVCGERLSALDAERGADFRRRHIGFVFQFFNLIPTMSAADNVAIPLLAERCSRREIKARVGAALAAVGLSTYGGRKASHLSGGEMQRVAIARALVMDPPLVLADEPTGNLDSVTGDSILQLLCTASRASGRAVLLVTHSYMATAYGDRTLAIRDGRVLEELPGQQPGRPPVVGVATRTPPLRS